MGSIFPLFSPLDAFFSRGTPLKFLQRRAPLFFNEHYFYCVACQAALLARFSNISVHLPSSITSSMLRRLAAYENVVDKPSSKLSVVLQIKSLRSHTSDRRQKIGVPIRFSVNTTVCV